MTFPPANATMIYNEDGEVLGWDVPSDEPYVPDPQAQQELDAMWEAAYEDASNELFTEDEERQWTDDEVTARAKRIVAEWKDRER